MFTFEHAGKHETKRLAFISTKIALLIFIYIGASQVVCDQEISFCDMNFKELKNDVEVWNRKCWNNGEQGEGTPYCKAEKEYNQERMKMHVEMCFYSGQRFIMGRKLGVKGFYHHFVLSGLMTTCLIVVNMLIQSH